jgi:hypothetical protein
VDQPISMEVGLLKCGAEEEKNGAQDGDHTTIARRRCSVLAYSSHIYQILYSAASISQSCR